MIASLPLPPQAFPPERVLVAGLASKWSLAVRAAPALRVVRIISAMPPVRLR
jgi:hypothetical protein